MNVDAELTVSPQTVAAVFEFVPGAVSYTKRDAVWFVRTRSVTSRPQLICGTESATLVSLLSQRPSPEAAALDLIREWLADDSGYDEAVWPSVKEAIEQNRLSYRKKFRG